MNQMKNVRIEKITLNVGAGKDQNVLEKGLKLLKSISGMEPVKTVTKKRIPGWGIRPGLPIGCKVTLRKDKAAKLLKRLLESKDNLLKPNQFDQNGNLAFGVPEYIDIPEVNYDPDIGIMGLEVCVTLERPGFRIKKRRFQKKKVGKNHLISKDDAINYMQSAFNIKVEDEE